MPLGIGCGHEYAQVDGRSGCGCAWRRYGRRGRLRARGGTTGLRPTHSRPGQCFVEELHRRRVRHERCSMVVSWLVAGSGTGVGGLDRVHVRPPAGPWRATRTADGCRSCRDLDPQHGVAGDVLLARTATGPLARNDRATLEDLATPDAPGLGPLDRTGQALDPQRAVPAERLGQLELGRRVGEPQVRVELAARQVRLHARRSASSGCRAPDSESSRSPLSPLDLRGSRSWS